MSIATPQRHGAASLGRGARVEWSLDPGDTASVPDLRHRIVGCLRALAAPGSDLTDAEIVVGELLSNALAHTRGPTWVQPALGRRRTRCSASPTSARSSRAPSAAGDLTHRPRTATARCTPELPADPLADGGRGAVPDHHAGPRRRRRAARHRRLGAVGDAGPQRAPAPPRDGRRAGRADPRSAALTRPRPGGPAARSRRHASRPPARGPARRGPGPAAGCRPRCAPRRSPRRRSCTRLTRSPRSNGTGRRPRRRAAAARRRRAAISSSMPAPVRAETATARGCLRAAAGPRRPGRRRRPC